MSSLRLYKSEGCYQLCILGVGPLERCYRGTVHKTTEFSPYQLLFVKHMRMPLDQMVRYWQGKEENDECSVSEYIATL